MLLSKRTELYLVFQSILLITLYIIYMIGGYKTYNIWSQIDTLAGYNPFTHLHHPHGLRYLIASPAVFLAEYYDWDRDMVFGLFVTFNLSLCAVITAWLQSVISQAIEKRWVVWLYLFIPIFLTLSFAMNGRLSYMLLGTALMMFAYTRWLLTLLRQHPVYNALPYIVLYSIGLTLLSVSSGCFTVGMIVALLQTFVLALVPQRITHKIFHATLNLAAPLLLAVLQYQFVAKNLGYYDGSVFAMLTHGPGQFLSVLNPDKYLLSALLGGLTFMTILLSPHASFFIQRNLLLLNPILFVVIALMVGMFGYSALLTGAIAAMVLTLHTGGFLFYSSAPPAVVIRNYLQANILHKPFSRTRKVVALAGALAMALAASLVLPDDWSVYSLKKVKTQYTNPITYQWDDRTITSHIPGGFVPGAMFKAPDGIIYIAENHTRILRLYPSGKIDVFTGSIEKKDRDGPKDRARFGHIQHMAMDKAGNIYVTDSSALKVKKVSPSGTVTTIAGSGKLGAFINGCKARQCRLTHPKAVMVLENGELLITDNIYLLRLRKDGRMRRVAAITDSADRKRTQP